MIAAASWQLLRHGAEEDRMITIGRANAPAGEPRELAPEVGLDERQRHVYAGGDARGGPDPAVDDVDRVAIYVDAGERPRQAIARRPCVVANGLLSRPTSRRASRRRGSGRVSCNVAQTSSLAGAKALPKVRSPRAQPVPKACRSVDAPCSHDRACRECPPKNGRPDGRPPRPGARWVCQPGSRWFRRA